MGKNQVTAAGEKLVVVDFFATWCGPCKMIAPVLEELSKTLEDVVFLKVDVDDVEEVAAEYKITAMPTFIFLKKNEQVAELKGANVEKLKELVESHRKPLSIQGEDFESVPLTRLLPIVLNCFVISKLGRDS